MPRVLHLPCSYMPWTIGGKETFTHSLARHLTDLGWNSHVAFHQNPANQEPLGPHDHEGIPVHVLPPLSIRREDVYACNTGEVPGFAELLGELKPDVVHFQDFSAGANLHHLALARAAKAKTVMSYHTPGQSCLQRELLRNGQIVCDGEIRLDRCTACRLGAQGIPAPIRWPLAKVSLPLAGESRLARALSARHMTQRFAGAWRNWSSTLTTFMLMRPGSGSCCTETTCRRRKSRSFASVYPLRRRRCLPSQLAPRAHHCD